MIQVMYRLATVLLHAGCHANNIGGMADHPLIVNLLSLNLKRLASIMMSGESIRVFSDCGFSFKGLGKTLGTGAIDHARSIGVLIATGSMHHKLLDELQQFIIVSGKFRRHKAINVLWGVQLGMRLQKDNDVGIRKAPLLKLYGVKMSCNFSQYALLDVLNKGLELCMKHSHHQVRTI